MEKWTRPHFVTTTSMEIVNIRISCPLIGHGTKQYVPSYITITMITFF
jgi:hypothetical protein